MGQTYLDRKGERLVVRGFRHWLSGYEFGDEACCKRQAGSLFTEKSGAVNTPGPWFLRTCMTG